MFRARIPVAALVPTLIATTAIGGVSGVGGAVWAADSARSVSVSQRFTIPSNGAFKVVGHGWGHGRGMSQYGAKGAAEKGRSHQQILAFYYPGTTMAQATGRVEVLITRDTTRSVVVLNQAGLTVRDLGTRTLTTLPGNLGAKRWRLEVSGTTTVLDYQTAQSTTWHRWKALRGDGRFESTTGIIALALPGGSVKKYRGWLEAASPRKGSSDRDTVNVLAVDNYLRGVVGSEMPGSWSPEAVQAQAVAARTYAWRARADSATYYDLCDTSSCQVYGGVSAESSAVTRAVTGTAGQILTYAKKPAFTQFSSSNGGQTAPGTVAYQVDKADPYDAVSGNPNHDWSVKAAESTLEKRYPKIGDLKSIKVTQRTGGGQWQGRVLKATLVGGSGSVSVTGDDLRRVLGLKSTWFTLRSS